MPFAPSSHLISTCYPRPRSSKICSYAGDHSYYSVPDVRFSNPRPYPVLPGSRPAFLDLKVVTGDRQRLVNGTGATTTTNYPYYQVLYVVCVPYPCSHPELGIICFLIISVLNACYRSTSSLQYFEYRYQLVS